MSNAAHSPAEQPKQGLGRSLLRLTALGLAVALFAWTLRDLDISRLGQLLRSVGPLALLILVPQAVGMLLHTAAWKELLAGLGNRAPLFALASTFFGSEATRMVAPAGPAVGESVAAFGIVRRFEVPWTRALASLAAKKAWVVLTHGACMVLLLVVGQAELDRLAAGTPQGRLLPWLAIGMTVALLAAGSVTLGLLSSRRVARAATSRLAQVRWERVRAWASRQRERPDTVAAATMPASRHALAGVFLFGQWMAEVLETWLVLRLLGVPFSFTEALLVELGGTMVRSLAFVVPGGLGVQDASYIGLLAALGVPGATEVGATFVLLKRTKELFYVAVGLFLLTLVKRGSRQSDAITVTP
ncbi:MAG: flippase-like domain-containing protein [Myxococcales bacterium]|nr:flippase-like domain-containing protein [Myxococcales bacterium]